MRVLGIDPGTRRLGWGVVEAQGNHLRHVAHGVIVLDDKLSLARRLADIDAALGEIISEFAPAAGSVETIFFGRDAQAAAKLGHARGVVLLRLARAGLDVHEYPPTRIKSTVVGRGQADKRQVAFMMRALLSLEALPPSDAADALAAAVTHLRRAPVDEKLGTPPRTRRRPVAARGRARALGTRPGLDLDQS